MADASTFAQRKYPSRHPSRRMKKSNLQKHNPHSRGNSRLSASEALLFGVTAGLAGGWAMTQFTKRWENITGSEPSPLPYSVQEWDATSWVAETCATRLLTRRPSAKELRVGAAIVHYAIAGAAGAAYGIVMRPRLHKSAWRGVFFGAAIWLAGNELLLPALGVFQRDDYTLGMKAHALGEHIAYGVTALRVYQRSQQAVAGTA